MDVSFVKKQNKVMVNRHGVYHIFKRCMDIVLSVFALIIFSPLMIIVVFAILLEDGGPVIYKQKRNGLKGKVFWIYKFRSMCKDAEVKHSKLLKYNELDGPAFKMKNDPRLTRVGRIIRKVSIDELPQFINIIKGEMSIVGPRPLPIYETKQCTPYQRQRLIVKPGLTCYWQCSGRNNISFDEWMEMDLKYLKEESLLVDALIILLTVKAVITTKGAF